MSAAPALAFAAGAAAVLGAWEWLAVAERSRLLAAMARATESVRRAGRDGSQPPAPERRRLAVLAAGALAAAGWLVAGVGAGAVCAVCGPALAIALVAARRRRHAAELRRGAADAARGLADALAAGHSVRGAIAAAAPGVAGAAGRELAVAARSLALGDPMETALERLRERANCPAWNAIVAGVLLQRDAGGNLAALLRDLSGSLDAAARAERDGQAATAQARFTARLVLGLPVAAAALAELAAPGLIASRLAQPLPATLVACAAALQLVAVAAIHRIASGP